MNRSLLRPIRWITCATILLGSVISGTGIAGAVVKNPNILGRDHGGVEVVGDGYVVCADGATFP